MTHVLVRQKGGATEPINIPANAPPLSEELLRKILGDMQHMSVEEFHKKIPEIFMMIFHYAYYHVHSLKSGEITSSGFLLKEGQRTGTFMPIGADEIMESRDSHNLY